jgi:hypothetical protein
MTDLCATFAPFCSIRAKTRCGSSSYAERAGRPLLMPKSQVVVLQFFYARPDAPRWTTPTPPPTLSPTVPSAARRRRLPRADIVDGDAMAGNRPAASMAPPDPVADIALAHRDRPRSRPKLRDRPAALVAGPVLVAGIALAHGDPGGDQGSAAPVTPDHTPGATPPSPPRPAPAVAGPRPGGPPGVGTDSHGRTDHPNARLKDQR